MPQVPSTCHDVPTPDSRQIISIKHVRRRRSRRSRCERALLLLICMLNWSWDSPPQLPVGSCQLTSSAAVRAGPGLALVLTTCWLNIEHRCVRANASRTQRAWSSARICFMEYSHATSCELRAGADLAHSCAFHSISIPIRYDSIRFESNASAFHSLLCVS